MPKPLEVERIEKVVEDFLESEGFELVDLRIGGSVSRPMIQVYADIEGGITTDDLGKLSRSLNIRLQVEGLINDNGTLVTSSPGLDRVLKRERDFARFMGRDIKVTLHEPIGNSRRLNGKLKGYENGTVLVEGTEEGDVALAEGSWKEIRLVPVLPDGFK